MFVTILGITHNDSNLFQIYTDDVQKLNGQRQESSRKHKNRGHVEAFQKPHDRKTGRQKRPKRRDGHIKRSRKEPVTETMCRVGRSIGHHQAVLPCRRKRTEKGILRQERRAPKFAIRLITIHANYGHADQDFCYVSNKRR